MTVNELKESLMSGKNPELLQKLAAAKTVSDAYKIAVEAGMTGSEEDFSVAVKSIMTDSNELPEEALKQIAGGVNLFSCCWIADAFVSLAGKIVKKPS